MISSRNVKPEPCCRTSGHPPAVKKFSNRKMRASASSACIMHTHASCWSDFCCCACSCQEQAAARAHTAEVGTSLLLLLLLLLLLRERLNVINVASVVTTIEQGASASCLVLHVHKG
jgi:hypothetical protein